MATGNACEALPHKIFNINEHVSWILGKSSPQNCLIAFRVEGYIEVLRFTRAINHVLPYFSHTQYSISNSNPGFFICSKGVSIDYSTTNISWRIVAQELLNSPFQAHERQLRFKVLQQPEETAYVMLCFNHILGDGTSGTKLLKTVIDCYNCGADKIYKRREKLGNIEVYPELHYEKYRNSSEVNIKEKTSGVKGIEISVPKLDKIKSAYFYEKLIRSMHDVFGMKKILLHLSVDLRKNKDQNANLSMGDSFQFLTSCLEFEYKFWRKNFEDIGVYIAHEIKSRLSLNQHKENLFFLKDAVDSCKSFKEFRQSFRSSKPMIGISNLGFLTKIGQVVGGLKISEWHVLANSQAYLGTPDSLTVFLTRLGKETLILNTTFPLPLVSEQNVSDFLESFKKSIIA